MVSKSFHNFWTSSFINKMSAYWKQHKSIILCTACTIFLIGSLVHLFLSVGKPKVQTSFSYVNGFFESTVQNNILRATKWIIQGNTGAYAVNPRTKTENFSKHFVYPIKMQFFSLNSADRLYESKKNQSQNDILTAYNATGNFRRTSYQIWDPNPEYSFTLLSHKFHILLHQDNSAISPTQLRVINIYKNVTEMQQDEEFYRGCSYKGYVRGDVQSSVTVSLCNGMTGHIRTSFGSFFIKPVYNFNCSGCNVLHKVWKFPSRNMRFILPSGFNSNVNNMPNKLFPIQLRKKRSLIDKQLFTMEVLVAVDKSMIDFHKADLKSYILTLISIVSNIFSDASIGNSIYVSVPTILLLKDDISTPRGQKNISASQLLKQFCSFLRKKGIHYDTAIMITRNQICRNEHETKCDTLGLAELGTVCKRYSCSIVQDNGLPAAFTIAHELGHILNMPHDDDSRCNAFKSYGKNTLHIMSSTMGDDIHPWSWSDCSRHYVSEFLEKEDTSCLEDSPLLKVPNISAKLPGELYSLDQQCSLIHGNQSKYCSIESDCTRLWCKAEKYHSNCRSSNLPWADGTPCGNQTYCCQQGKCMPRNGIKRLALNGGWGPWSSFTPCSMTCGGGVQESERECNKPFPQNGGKYCVGSRKKYRSCKVNNCPYSSFDSREQQCFDMNGNNFGLKGVDFSVRWIPKYGLIGKDKCKLYCRWDSTSAYFQLGDKVKDGTICSFESFDKCVNGICRPAGCDNELNSVASLDKCGVCEGKNDTCEEYFGHFYKSNFPNKTNSMYFYVTTIPKGSSNILITQPGYHTQNYIVLRNSDNDSLLNGNRVINLYRYVFFYAGVSFEYNGSNNTIERVNTTYSRKLKKDLIVEIISLSLESMKNDSVLLSYSYTTDKHIKLKPYQWQLKDWSPCDTLCQGSSFQTADCINKMLGLKVSPPFCDSSKKPRPQYRTCNMNCYLTLKMSTVSESPASCGVPAQNEDTHYCMQTNTNTNTSSIVDMSHCERNTEMHHNEDCEERCCDYSDFSLVTTQNDWIVNKWGACDDNCERRRNISCSFGNICPLKEKPIHKKRCCIVKYIPSWSPCAVECGIGNRRKEFYCAKVHKSEKKGLRRKKIKVDLKYCNNLKLPTPKRLNKNCKMTCGWSADVWSKCPSDCSTEFQIRAINCTNNVGQHISNMYCQLTKKPKTEQICAHCVRREYKITKCNCEGFRKRQVVCSNTNGEKIQCPNKPKILKEKCRSPEHCCPKLCSDIKRSHQKVVYDREYTLFLKGKPKTIFCHNMNGKPEEYITLNPSENYSIYYNNKTKFSGMCPPESRNFEYRDFTINCGRTHFHKVAIDIASLRVIENDFTFTDSIDNAQPFGSAGDCYNPNGECPQGDFSLNFSFTGFVINPSTRWDIYGNRAVMKTSNDFTLSSTNRRAFCGGYCGRCAISTRTGLVLDV